MKKQLRIVAACLAALTMMTAGLFVAAPAASADTPTCPAGASLDDAGQCTAAATTETVDAVVVCPDGYSFSAATGNCSGPGMYAAAVPAGPAVCSDALIAAAANLQAAAGGSVTASVIDNGNCEIRLEKVEPQIVNCPKDAPLISGFILNGAGACEYAASAGTPAIPAMCNGAAAPGTTAEDCTDTEPVTSVTCADPQATLDGTSCSTTTCSTGTLSGSSCVSPATPKPVDPPAPNPGPAPTVSVPAAGLAGPLVTAGTSSISTPVVPTKGVVAAPATSELAVTGSTTATGITVALSLVAAGALALIWSDFFGRRRSQV